MNNISIFVVCASVFCLNAAEKAIGGKQSHFEDAQKAWDEGRKEESDAVLKCALEDEKARHRLLAKGMSFLEEDGATGEQSFGPVLKNGKQAIVYLNRDLEEKEDQDGSTWCEKLQKMGIDENGYRSESPITITPPSSLTEDSDEQLLDEIRNLTEADRDVVAHSLYDIKENASQKKPGKKRLRRIVSDGSCVDHSGTVTHKHSGIVTHKHIFSFSDGLSFVNPDGKGSIIVRHIIVSEEENESESSFPDQVKTRHCVTPVENVEDLKSFKVVKEEVIPSTFLNSVQSQSKRSYLNHAGCYVGGLFSGVVGTIGFLLYNTMQQHGCTDQPDKIF